MATRSERAEPRAERSEAGGGALGLSIYNKAPAGRFVFKSFYIAPVTIFRDHHRTQKRERRHPASLKCV